MKHYKLVSDSGEARVVTAKDMFEAINVFNAFKKRHPEQRWALVLGTLDKFSLLKR